MEKETYYFYNTYLYNLKELKLFCKRMNITYTKKYFLGLFLFKNISNILDNGKKKINDKIIYNYLNKKYINYINNIKKKDKEAYYDYKYLKNPNQPLICESYGKAISTSKIILNLLNKTNINLDNINSYMDFGAGNGINAKTIGLLLNIKNNNIHCLDIKNAEFKINQKNLNKKCNVHIYDGINFNSSKNLNNEINILKNNSISLITCFQVLHHIPINVLDNIIKQMYEKLNKNGVLIIKEHNAKKKDINYLQVVHYLYYITNGFTYQNAKNELGFNYTNKSNLTKILKRNKFSKIGEIDNKYHPTYNYYTIFKKYI